MTSITEPVAVALPAAQAAALVRVLDLEAAWLNLRDDPPTGRAAFTPARLQRLQAAFADYRQRAVAYAARYPAPPGPEFRPSGAERLAAWARAVRAAVGRTQGEPGVEYPAHLTRLGYRLADRVAARTGAVPVGRAIGRSGVAAAIADLDAIARWCQTQLGPARLVRARAG